MAWTINEAIASIREILKDEVSDAYRYSDESLIRIMNIGFTELHTKRPDAFIVSEPWTVVKVSDMDAAFPVALNFFNPIIYFVCGYAELRDDEYSRDQRAAILLEQFRMEVTGDRRV
tara:strand:+ start:897 stop:1247 length:351 start_codon:yes stop_codon:yes gene_type:complete